MSFVVMAIQTVALGQHIETLHIAGKLLLVGAVVAIWIERLTSETIKFSVESLLVGLALYPALIKSEYNNRLWSTAEDIHWQAGGGMNSAIMRPRKSIYHWYTYYFPYSLVDNMNDLWEKFLCQDVDN